MAEMGAQLREAIEAVFSAAEVFDERVAPELLPVFKERILAAIQDSGGGGRCDHPDLPVNHDESYCPDCIDGEPITATDTDAA